MRRHRILLTLVALIIGVVVLQEPAGADCAGPTLAFETGEFARGASIAVIGSSFGLECYDTGPPPPGEGLLGPPIQDIEILFVQGDSEWVVATGDAGNDYGFRVDILVPLDAEPGDGRITARFLSDWEPWIQTTEAVTITDAAPVVDEWAMATFGPAAEPSGGSTEVIESTTTTALTTTSTSPPSTTTEPIDGADPENGTDGDTGTTRATGIAVGILIVAAAVGGLLVLSRREGPSAT